MDNKLYPIESQRWQTIEKNIWNTPSKKCEGCKKEKCKKTNCKKCNGTGTLDFGFYTRDCDCILKG